MIGALAVSSLTTLFAWVRLYLGIDFTDEGLYSAIPYRFFLGDRPFIDEWNLTQHVSMLLYPIDWVYLRLFSTDGFFLFNRRVAFAVQCVVGLAFFRALKRDASLPLRILIAALPPIFVPYNLMGPSYNLFGSCFLALGSLLSVVDRVTPGRSLAIGVLHGVAVFAYPTLLVPATGFWLAAFWFRGVQPKQAALYALGGVSVPLALFTAYQVSPADFLNAFSHTAKIAAGFGHSWDLKTVGTVLKAFVESLNYPLACFGFVVGFVVAVKRANAEATWALSLGLLVLLFFANREVNGGHGIMGSVRYLGFLAPFAYVLIKDRTARAAELLWKVWMPSVLAAVAMAWSSNMYVEAMGVPMLAAVGVGLVFLAQIVRQTTKAWTRWEVWTLGPTALLLVMMAYARLVVYMDFPLRQLTERVTTGPFAGLYTTPQRAGMVSQLTQDLDRVSAGARAILFFPHFPGGYLLSRLPAAAPSVWDTCPNPMSSECAGYYERKASGSGVIVEMHRLDSDPNRIGLLQPVPESNEVVRLMRHEHRKVITRENYSIYLTLPKASKVTPNREG